MNKNILTFDKWARQGKDEGMERGHHASVEHMLNIIFKYYEKINQKYSVIDFGCGNGWVVRKLKEHSLCKDAHGLDGAKSMIKKAEKYDSDGMYFNEDINIWIPPQKYEVVFSMETLYYFKNPGKIINTIYDDVLIENGMLIIGIDHYAENKASLNWGDEFNLDITTLSIETWLSLFESAGLNNIHFKQVEAKESWAGTLIISGNK